jgi:acyl-CoA dehydrogenase
VGVARRVLRDVQAPPGIWPSEHVPTRRRAAHEKFANYLAAATANL